MLLTVLPDFDQQHPSLTRKSPRIVWQQRYEGVAVVAYQGGKAVACISGPWSSKYVLTWWEPMPGGQLEIFDTQDEAMQAVERRISVFACGRPIEVVAVTGESHAPDRNESWCAMLLRAFLPRRRRASATHPRRVHELRQRYLNADTDLSGLNFSAIA